MHIHLEGEEDGEVPIFDTCDDVRKKINECLKGPTSQTQLCREISEMMPHESLRQRQLANFLKFKGPKAGAHSPVFYGDYVFFEKLRLSQEKKKGAKREKLEEIWGKKGGFPREGSHNIRLSLPQGDNWTLDYLGQVHIHRRDGSERIEAF